MSYSMSPTMQMYAVRTSTLGTRARTLTVQLVGGGAEGADATAEVIPDVEVFQPLGLFTRPQVTSNTEAVGVEVGDEVWALGLIDKGGGGVATWPMTDVDEGETRLYGAAKPLARLRLRATGAVELEAVAGQPLTVRVPGGGTLTLLADGSFQLTSLMGTDIVLNAGSLRVARERDTLNVGTLAATAGPYPVTFTYTPGGFPAPGPPVTGPTVSLTGIVANGTGASNVKA